MAFQFFVDNVKLVYWKFIEPTNTNEMFYYKPSKNPKLEVSISEYYSDTDVQRIFDFIEALIDNKTVTVIFKVNPLIKKDFKQLAEKNNSCSFYNYQIQ